MKSERKTKRTIRNAIKETNVLCECTYESAYLLRKWKKRQQLFQLKKERYFERELITFIVFWLIAKQKCTK